MKVQVFLAATIIASVWWIETKRNEFVPFSVGSFHHQLTALSPASEYEDENDNNNTRNGSNYYQTPSLVVEMNTEWNSVSIYLYVCIFYTCSNDQNMYVKMEYMRQNQF